MDQSIEDRYRVSAPLRVLSVPAPGSDRHCPHKGRGDSTDYRPKNCADWRRRRGRPDDEWSRGARWSSEGVMCFPGTEVVLANGVLSVSHPDGARPAAVAAVMSHWLVEFLDTVRDQLL
jgi:hypothetical protein